MLNPVTLPIATPVFNAFVDDLARPLLRPSPNFEAFVQALPGVLPEEALASLKRLGGADAKRLALDARVDRAPAFIDQSAHLPLPHPMDSEFRFDTQTAAVLAQGLIATTRAGDEILLVGVPSVAIELAALGVDRRIRYLGPNNCVTSAVRAAITDDRLMLHQGEGGTAAAALLDPPWYRDPMRHLVRVSAFGCRPGANVHLVLPSLGTRPEIEAERKAFVGFALDAGLLPTGSTAQVSYRTPLFELAAMEQQKIARLPNWRRGDVVEFRLSGSRVQRETWLAPRSPELSVDGVRLRILAEAGVGASAGVENLTPISDHEIFPSVSARAPGRGLATLWTTTNRAFLVDPDSAREALRAFATATGVLHSGIGSAENDLLAVSRVAPHEGLIHQVSELIGRELSDARRLVGDGAWLKTAVEWRC